MSTKTSIGAEGEWISVPSRKRERRSSNRDQSSQSDGLHKPLSSLTKRSPTLPQRLNHSRKGKVVPHPSLPTSSIIRQRHISLLNGWYSTIQGLAQKNPREIIAFLVQNWQTFKALIQHERFHIETASFVKAMAVLSECDEFIEVEFIILMVLMPIKIRQLPQSCHCVSFFKALCRIFASFLKHGSLQAANWIHGRHWVLISIDEAIKHLSCNDAEAESVIEQLQNIDLGFSARFPNQEKSMIINKRSKAHEEKNCTPSECMKVEPKGRQSYGISRQWPAYVSPHFPNGSATAVQPDIWQTVKRKKTASRKMQDGSFHTNAPPSDIYQPPFMITPKGKKVKSKGTAPFSSNNNAGPVRKEVLLTSLKENWSPLQLPYRVEEVMKSISLMRKGGSNPSLQNFIMEVCSTPLVDNMREFLRQKMRIGFSPETFKDIINFCSTVLKTNPNVFSECFGVIVNLILQAADTFEQDLQFTRVKTELMELRRTLFQTKYVSDPVPQESFRDMFVVPTAEDFEDREVFLRPNIVCGPYPSEEDYLDYQFRLLREDFLKPLRQGVAEIRGRVRILEKREENRFNAMRIYRGVTFARHSDRRAPGTLMMSFDPNRNINVDWRSSKRFMIGALLVISNDDFETLHLARVSRRDLEYLSAGCLIIEPLWSEVSARKLCQGTFVVGESMVFFEPYLHVLNALQNTQADMFPLARYIVGVDPSGELPDYLQDESNRRFTIPLLGSNCDESVSLDIVSGEWPSPTDLGLNESQHEALVRALTQKVMLVQGPPGTGKTFLGLRIVSTLLNNPHAWRCSNSSPSPILIICYTNHALDQFLVGLLGTTDKIVRVGGRCKDERLENYMLKRNEEDLSRDLKKLMWERKKTLEEAEIELECVQAALRALNDNIGIVSWESLKLYQVVPEELSDTPPDFSVISWLEEGLDHSTISEEDKRFLRPNPKWGNKCFTFEDTFNNMERSLEELQQLVDEGRVAYASKLRYYICKLKYLKEVTVGEPEMLQTQTTASILDLDAGQRPQLYRFWISQLRVALARVERCAEKYLRDCKTRVQQVRMLKDKELIASNLVVGMTTTKAAALQPLLQELRPSIVVVEEAAEVLESHIVAALTPHVQHLILLGDHKQLRPSPADHEVAKDFKLEVSLFERLCNNNMPCKALNIQHRMRPEIASLIQFIYPGLANHSSVTKYPEIRGLKNSLFFVDHQHAEQWMDELMSHSNPHEAKFIAALVTYLLYQGYDDKQITVLTAYSGQLMYLKGLEFDYPDLRRVRMCNVDNFQGEESDIVILSLVRSNPQNSIGFLKTENRVCVALSRAKHGMIIVGNLRGLTAKSDAWRQVQRALHAQQAVGPALTLRCAIHPERLLKVKCGADFVRWAFGGCDTRCDFTLRCRHKCPRKCHRDSLDHDGILCLEPCNRMVCNKDHPPYFCSRLCYEPCEPCHAEKYVRLDCHHMAKMKCAQDPYGLQCMQYKTVQLRCGHTAKMQCSMDPETYLCKKKERRVLELCGHENMVVCYRNGPCKVLCEAKLPCGHRCKKECHKFVDPEHVNYKCSQPCLRTRPGCTAESKHPCSLKCGDKCVACDVIVTKSLPCRHNVKMPCSEPATHDRCKATCPRKLPCTHKCQLPCGQECGKCEVEVSRKHPVCGHDVVVPCNADVGRQLCTKPCEKILQACGHKCVKECGKNCQPCTVKVPKKLPNCDHILELPCGTDVQFEQCPKRCTKSLPCRHRCHSRCSDPCQTQCRQLVSCPSPCGHSVKVPCNEKDDWSSEDARLMLMARCKRECTTKLQCGHKCKGSCSDCHQGRLHRVCNEKCMQLLVCGHRCQDECGQPCLPCKQPCPVKCVHLKCIKRCGQQCSPCSEKCEMGKPAFKCKSNCRERCTWTPSKENCMFPNKDCRHKHDCIGLHGDPCPTLCRICDKDRKEFELSSEEDRFLLLTDCSHTVRYDAMERAVKERATVVKFPYCPTCKAPVWNSSRYGNLVRERQEHIVGIYKRLSWTSQLKDTLKAKLEKLAGTRDSDQRSKRLIACAKSDSPKTYQLMASLCEAMKAAHAGAHSEASARTMRGLCTFADLLSMMDGCLRSVAMRPSSLRRKVASEVDALSAALAAQSWKGPSVQQVLDLNTELLRIQRLQHLCMLEEDSVADDLLSSDADYLRVSEILRTIGPYPRKTLDDAVCRSIERLAADRECIVDTQWWEELPLPTSASEGSWYLCGKGHVYPKTGTGRSCNKCRRECDEHQGN